MTPSISLRSHGPLALTAMWLADRFTTLAAAARRHAQAAARRRQVRLTVDALRAVDRRTLRDLGLHSSEIGSIAAEASGAIEQIEQTRMRVWQQIGGRIV